MRGLGIARRSLSQDIDKVVQSHDNFGPITIEADVLWEWKRRAHGMEVELERLRKEKRNKYDEAIEEIKRLCDP